MRPAAYLHGPGPPTRWYAQAYYWQVALQSKALVPLPPVQVKTGWQLGR